MTITLIADIGNFSTKIIYTYEGEVFIESFSSIVAPFKELEDYGEMVRLEYKERDYLTGNGVENLYAGKTDRMYYGNIRKGHNEGMIRLLNALHKVTKKTKETSFNLVLTSPYVSLAKDKQFFIDNFLGKNSALINGIDYNFEVKNIIVASEGLGALNYTKEKNLVIVDAGSMTMNILTIINRRISVKETFALNGGTLTRTPFELAYDFSKKMNEVDFDFYIVVTGGKANEIKVALEKQGYTNVNIPDIPEDQFYLINSLGLYEEYIEEFERNF